MHNTTGVIKDEKELEFAVFCIENVAIHLNANPTQIFEALTEKSNILNDYIVKNYDVLHTQGKEYIVDDVIEVMKERNVVV